MSETESWLERYEVNHRDLTWPWIYWAAVPMVVVGTVGALWSRAVPPESYDSASLLNRGRPLPMRTARTAGVAEPGRSKPADLPPDPVLDQLSEADLPTFLRRTFPSR